MLAIVCASTFWLRQPQVSKAVSETPLWDGMNRIE
jgi:hypothetical protein